MEQNNIPKTIHYCWFGGKPLPPLAQKCIASWKKFCPDYKIIEWNESNFDLNCCDYVKEAYEAKKWAFVSDVARLYALVNHGGIYMDTDVEVLKPLDDLLLFEAFSGFEDIDKIPTGIMACEKGQSLFEELLKDYDSINFINKDGSMDLTTNVKRITDSCLKYGLELNNVKQTVNGFMLFPKEYFCPLDSKTGKLNVTENTYTIHHFAGSWTTSKNKINTKIYRFLNRFLGKKIAAFLKKIFGRKK